MGGSHRAEGPRELAFARCNGSNPDTCPVVRPQPESHVFYRTKNRNVPPLVIVRDFHIDRFFIQFSGIGGFGRLAVTAI